MLTSLAYAHMVDATWCWQPLHLHTWSAPRDVDLTFWAAPPGPQFLRKLGPDFHDTGPEIGARFPAKPLRRKSVPNLGRAWGESSLLPLGCKLVCLQLGQIRVASTAIHHHLLHSHRLRSRPDQIQNPKSKLQTSRLDFGFWSLDFGFWSLEFGVWILDFGFRNLDFGFWILEFGFWISLVFVLFVAAPNGAVWILEFGFRILEFGFWILVWMRPQPTSFGSCIRYFHVTPTRVGGLYT